MSTPIVVLSRKKACIRSAIRFAALKASGGSFFNLGSGLLKELLFGSYSYCWHVFKYAFWI